MRAVTRSEKVGGADSDATQRLGRGLAAVANQVVAVENDRASDAADLGRVAGNEALGDRGGAPVVNPAAAADARIAGESALSDCGCAAVIDPAAELGRIAREGALDDGGYTCVPVEDPSAVGTEEPSAVATGRIAVEGAAGDSGCAPVMDPAAVNTGRIVGEGAAGDCDCARVEDPAPERRPNCRRECFE